MEFNLFLKNFIRGFYMAEARNTKKKELFHVYFKVNENFLDINFHDEKDLQNKINEYLDISDNLEMLNENLIIRKKYRNLFRVTKKGVQFLFDIDKWTNFDKVTLILLSHHPLPVERNYIWLHNLDADQLRQVIFSKKDEIYTLGDDLVGLKIKGFLYIEEKMNKILEV